MIIWWLLDLFDSWSESEPLTQFCQAMLSQNTSGQACTRRKGDLGFVGFIAARRSLWFRMSAVTIIRTQVCELPITVFAFETQESLGLLALRLTFLTAHWWQQISLSKMFRTPCQIMIVCCTCNRSRNYKAMADFEAFYRLRNGNRSVWARCFTFRVRRWLFSVQVTEAGITRPWPISKHSTK